MEQTVTIEVFKTDITSEKKAAKLKSKLLSIHSDLEIDFDLQDCDHILRVVGPLDQKVIIQAAGDINIFVEAL